METLVLVLTDVEGSTRLWQDEPGEMDAAMRRHHAIVHGAVAAHGGFRPPDQGEGDAVFAAFSSATAAIAAVVQVQRELASEPWPTSVPLRVRIGVHVGEVQRRDGNLYGDAVSRCARLRGLGCGGQTLLSAAAFELVRNRLPTGTWLSDLGEHRMKDLAQPEHVHQLNISGLDNSFPALPTGDRRRHNLPVQAAPFIGREAELSSLLSALREHRLVTLVGLGGMGKTRLALQAATALADQAEVGDVWFVDLSTVTDPALVPARVAEAVGVRFGAGDPAAGVVAALAARPALLVLDNLEQVLECAGFVADLVARTAAVRVLATSREPLRVRAERQVPLAPMTLPRAPDLAKASAESLCAYEAVRFFVDRAGAVRPDFAVTDENAAAVAAICLRLDGHPLALELAAARLKMLSVEQLLARLDSGLAVLAGGARDMPERHQTLRAAIAWSYEALSPDEQLLLARLSALPAAAPLDMIEAVCGAGLEVYDRLEALVERSLVRTTELDGEVRFGLLVSVRDFAAEHLDETATRDIRDRHAAHVAVMLDRPRPQFSVVGFVARELPHLRAALGHLEAVGAFDTFVAVVVGLQDGLLHNGHLAEFVRLAERALQHSDDPWQRAQLQLARGMSLSGLGDSHGSRAAFELGLADARQCGDPDVYANSVVIALASARTRAELDQFVAEYHDVRELLAPEVAETFDREEANVMGRLLRYVDPHAAEEAARRAHEGVRCVRLAQVLLDTGRTGEACDVLAQVQDPSIFGGMRAWELRGLAERARAELLQGHTARARSLASQAFEGQLSIGAQPFDSAVVLAHIERRSGDPEAAAAVLDHALAHGPQSPDAQSAQLLWRRGAVNHSLGRAGAALRDVTAARDVLAAEEFYVLELLGCLAAEALVLGTTDARRSAQLLGSVEANRGSWVLPFDMDDAAASLTARLASSYGDELARGRHLPPAVVAQAARGVGPAPA